MLPRREAGTRPRPGAVNTQPARADLKARGQRATRPNRPPDHRKPDLADMRPLSAAARSTVSHTESAFCGLRQLSGSPSCLLSVTEVRPGGAPEGTSPSVARRTRVHTGPPLTQPLSSRPWPLRPQRTDDARREWPRFPYAPIRAGRGAWLTTSRLPAPTGPRSGADGAHDAGSCATGPGLCPFLAAGRPARNISAARRSRPPRPPAKRPTRCTRGNRTPEQITLTRARRRLTRGRLTQTPRGESRFSRSAAQRPHAGRSSGRRPASRADRTRTDARLPTG
jgi:hypothetical protein